MAPGGKANTTIWFWLRQSRSGVASTPPFGLRFIERNRTMATYAVRVGQVVLKIDGRALDPRATKSRAGGPYIETCAPSLLLGHEAEGVLAATAKTLGDRRQL